MFGKRNGLFSDGKITLEQGDPEFIELFSRFAYDEVVNEPGAQHPDLDDATRSMAILATLIGCRGVDAYEMMLPVALETGVTPVQVKEVVYQAVAYLGFGRVLPFLKTTNEVFIDKDINLPLEGQSRPVPLPANSRRSTSSARTCAVSRNRGRRRPVISTSGWPTTVSATTTRATV